MPGRGEVGMRALSARQVSFVVAMIGIVFVLGWLSHLTRPSAAISNAWWPAAGVAIGAGIRLPRRYAGLVALGAGLVSIPVAAAISGSYAVGVALACASMLETFIGIVILRGRRDRLPTLREPRDMLPLLVATLVASVVLDVAAASIQAVMLGGSTQLFGLTSAAPRHAAGILLITPLFMHIPRRPRSTGRLETSAQVVVAAATTVAVFRINDELPLAFLPFVPLVWAALVTPTRVLVTEIIALSAIAAYGSAHGTGPFDFGRLGPVDGSLVLQVFQASMLVVFLTLSLVVGREQDGRRLLADSEQLFRNNFDTSFSGIVILDGPDRGWTVRRHNAAAAAILPAMRSGEHQDLGVVIGSANADALAAAARSSEGFAGSLALELPGGRHLAASLVSMGGTDARDTYAFQFIDVTDSMRARRLMQEELDRAAEVHRALTPTTLPQVPGWTCAAVSSPARQVGGDFYDLQVLGDAAALSLGDVMGKGIGAGMLASSVRAALRAAAHESPSGALRTSAAVLDGDLARSGAFATVASAVVDLRLGRACIADAGHGLIFLVRADGSVERVGSTDLPLGIGADWCDTGVALAPGDALLLLSDGVMDLWGESVGGLERAIEQSALHAGGDVHRLVERLCASADENLDRDDVTALVLGRDLQAGG